MTILEAQEAVSPLDDNTYLTPERARAGVALLRARGYRSAELYLSTALRRHKANFPMSTQPELASKDAARMAKRGRGPPQVGQYDHAALTTGIWFLLRVSEFRELDVGDVKVRWGPRGLWQVATNISASKTDPQAQGVTIARDCTCPPDKEASMCPVHVLWNQAQMRKDQLDASGCVNLNAPLFTDETGARVTEARVLAAIENVARDAGEPLEVKGVKRYGTHSMRVAGALWVFEAGVPRPLENNRCHAHVLEGCTINPRSRRQHADRRGYERMRGRRPDDRRIPAGGRNRPGAIRPRPRPSGGASRAPHGHPPRADGRTAPTHKHGELDHQVRMEMVGGRHRRSLQGGRYRAVPQVLPRSTSNLAERESRLDTLSQQEFHGKISVEQTLQIIYVRHGRSNLDDEITEIFGQQQKGSDGQELKISFSQYLARANARLSKLRWQDKKVTNPAKK
eukprot:s236_g23.t1